MLSDFQSTQPSTDHRDGAAQVLRSAKSDNRTGSRPKANTPNLHACPDRAGKATLGETQAEMDWNEAFLVPSNKRAKNRHSEY